VRQVASRFAGERPPAYSSRKMSVQAHKDDSAERLSALLAPRTVRVARVVRETKDAVSLVLEDPMGAPFAFIPGQFFTLIVPVGGEVLRRAYSVSSDVRDTAQVSVTVKRVAGGVVSNHVNDHVREGDLLQVLGPSGSFTAEASGKASGERHLVLLAGGSGITPMMAIARSTLAADPKARVTLVYGNRAEEDVIFYGALADLAKEHGSRFAVRHVLSHPPAGWSAGVGVLEESVVARELDACNHGEHASFFLCGPEPMMRAARAALLARGVAEERILEERFNMPHLRARPAAAIDASPQVLTIRANGAGVREVYVAPDQTMLEAGLSSGVKMDYSCAMGGCAACKVKLCEGDVEMEEPNCLTAKERGQGYVLACISRVRGPTTIALAGDPGFAPEREEAAE
jgi:ferredoxin-NADP reductase